MKREIKFRAWVVNPPIKEMHYSSQIQINSADAKSFQLRVGFEDAYPEKNNIEQWQKDIVWMQYTGLTDKNGKEIYEGDLDQDGGRVFYNESMARFQIDYGGDVDIADMEDVGEWMIVSGNIYENKELLNSSLKPNNMQNIPSGLIPYNHEKYLTGKYIAETRGGVELKQVERLDGLDQPIVYASKNCCFTCSDNGKYLLGDDSEHDLFLRPKTVKKWHPMFKNWLYDSEEECKSRCDTYSDFLKAGEVEVNEE